MERFIGHSNEISEVKVSACVCEGEVRRRGMCVSKSAAGD